MSEETGEKTDGVVDVEGAVEKDGGDVPDVSSEEDVKNGNTLVEGAVVEGREEREDGVVPLIGTDVVDIIDEPVVGVTNIDENLDVTTDVVSVFPEDLESPPNVTGVPTETPYRN